MNEKVIGYILLSVGVLIIVGTAISAILVFTGNASPIQLISQNTPLSLNLSIPIGETGASAKVPVNLGDLPFFKIINSGLHLVLMGFLASIGAKIATIGTNLIRPIVIQAKEK